MNRRQVGILVFDDVEVLDFCGPFEVFSVTRLEESRRREEPSPYSVLLVADSRDSVTTTGGMRVQPDFCFDHCPALDVAVIPGGWGTRALAEDERTLEWIRKQADKVETLTSVCTGSLLLGSAGLLGNKRATSHWAFLDSMRERFPETDIVADEHVVQDGNLFTAAGISAGIDMALRVVARHHGEPVARATARHMEYPYPEDNRRRIDLSDSP